MLTANGADTATCNLPVFQNKTKEGPLAHAPTKHESFITQFLCFSNLVQEATGLVRASVDVEALKLGDPLLEQILWTMSLAGKRL